MNDIFSIQLIAATLSLLIAVLPRLLANREGPFRILAERFFNVERKVSEESYKQKMERLTDNLLNASSEVDQVLSEIATESQNRALAVNRLEEQLTELSNREREVQERIETLEKVPLEAVQHFEQIMKQGDRRSALRDYMLFGLGVLVSTVIAVLLGIIGI